MTLALLAAAGALLLGGALGASALRSSRAALRVGVVSGGAGCALGAAMSLVLLLGGVEHTFRIAFVLQDATFRRLLERRAMSEAILDRLAELRPAGERGRQAPRGQPKGTA